MKSNEMKKELILGSNIIEMVEEIKEMMQCCDNCGQVTEDLVQVNNGDCVCSDCLDDYGYCDNCNEYYPIDEMIYFDDEWYCEDCIDRVSTVCDGCGDRFSNDYVYYCDNTGDYRCEDCYVYEEDCNIDYDGDIYNYMFMDTGTIEYDMTKRYFGIEIETDKYNDCASANNMLYANQNERFKVNGLQFYYGKEDVSLSDVGIEFVSQPATIEIHNTFNYDEWFRVLHYNGANREYIRSVGLHIHVNNDSLGIDMNERDFTKAKLLLLVGALDEYLLQVSRRGCSSSWCKSNTKLDIEYTNNRELNIWRLSQAYRYSDKDRYQMLNISNSATIEFRLFANATSREDVLCALEICNHLIDYAMNHTIHQCMKCTPFRLHRENKPSEMLSEYYESQGVIWLKK